MPFTFTPLSGLPDVTVIEPRVFPDGRGFFLEAYKESDFKKFGIDERFRQDNHSCSTKGVLRGLHYQMPPHAQGKLVRCIVGEIFDVVADVRRSSSTFGKWRAIVLSAHNKKMLYVPPGFAHGFYTISDIAEITYKVTAEYCRESERGVIWNDITLGVAWPSTEVSLSDKDLVYPPLCEAEVFP